MKNILIIEDDLIDQMAFSRMLDKHQDKYQYSTSTSAQDAKEKLNETKFDLVISDLNLPDGTTFDLITQLKNVPLILITGNENRLTVESLIQKTNVIGNFTKDISLKYLNELPTLIHEFFTKEKSDFSQKKKANQSFILEHESVKINLQNAYNIFDGKKEDVKEAIEIFINNKPVELDNLYNSLNNKDCHDVLKIVHRMKSGFRILGMAHQEKLADFIHSNITQHGSEKCYSPEVMETFKQLSSDIKVSVNLLGKELQAM